MVSARLLDEGRISSVLVKAIAPVDQEGSVAIVAVAVRHFAFASRCRWEQERGDEIRKSRLYERERMPELRPCRGMYWRSPSLTIVRLVLVCVLEDNSWSIAGRAPENRQGSLKHVDKAKAKALP